MDFQMRFMDSVAIYGAVVATAVALWDVIKWRKAQAHITLSCYLTKMVDNMVVPSGGRLCNGTSDEEDRQRERFIAYNIKNTGGTAITVQSLASKDKDGQLKVVCGKALNLPQTIQPAVSVTVPVPLDGTEGTIRGFYVRDAIGREWCCKACIFQKQLAEYRRKMGN